MTKVLGMSSCRLRCNRTLIWIGPCRSVSAKPSRSRLWLVMTDLLELKPDDAVLEIGTGLGYQSAVLAELAGRVCSIEIIDELAQRAAQRLKRLLH
jgi:protein-L-isoaspartate O-methyltransferase